ncbi:MAG: nitronate monooxygenase [Sphingobium sp.]|nr:nitronate monooxygenase [Sphingobium sp.]
MTTRRDAFARRIGVRFPVIAAPMAGAAGPELAIAALKAGGLGSLPCALLAIEQMHAQADEVRGAIGGPLHLNFFCHDMPDDADETAWRALLAPYYSALGVAPPEGPGVMRLPFSEAQCAAVEAIRPEIVSFHFGLPGPALLARVKAAGACILASATTVREAQWLAAQGIDAVIAQGAEAGGHASHFLDGAPETHMGLFALLPQIVDAVPVPVIAAGGIADARGVAAAFILGASAVQLGTAFLHGPENRITPMHRAALSGPDAAHTQFTRLFTGRPARGIPNRLMRDLGAMNPAAPPFPHASIALAPLKAAAEAQGDTGFSSLWAGQASLLARPMSAGERITTLMADTDRLLADAARERI